MTRPDPADAVRRAAWAVGPTYARAAAGHEVLQIQQERPPRVPSARNVTLKGWGDMLPPANFRCRANFAGNDAPVLGRRQWGGAGGNSAGREHKPTADEFGWQGSCSAAIPSPPPAGERLGCGVGSLTPSATSGTWRGGIMAACLVNSEELPVIAATCVPDGEVRHDEHPVARTQIGTLMPSP